MHDRPKQQPVSTNNLVWFEDGYLSFDVKQSQYNAVIEVPPIKNIVLTAGGSRGLYYVGALQAFEEFIPSCDNAETFLEQVEAFSGTSIGALLSAAIACGMRSKRLKEYVTSLDFNAVLGRGRKVPFAKGTEIWRDGKPFYCLAQEISIEGIRTQLQEILHKENRGENDWRDYLLEKAAKLPSAQQTAVRALIDELSKIERYEFANITSDVLENLHYDDEWRASLLAQAAQLPLVQQNALRELVGELDKVRSKTANITYLTLQSLYYQEEWRGFLLEQTKKMALLQETASRALIAELDKVARHETANFTFAMLEGLHYEKQWRAFLLAKAADLPLLRRTPLFQLIDELDKVARHGTANITVAMLESLHYEGDLRAALLDHISQETVLREEASQALIHELDKVAHRDIPKITFAMQSSLHHINSGVFKELYATAVCKETGEAYSFSADTSPDLEIARAVHASAAIPVYMNQVKIEKRYLTLYRDKPEVPDVLHMVDGGYLDASPFEAVEGRQKKEIGFNVGGYNENLQTLIIMPDDTKAANYDGDMEQVLAIPEEIPRNKPYPQSPMLNYREFSPHELAPPSFFVDLISNFVPRLFNVVKSNVVYTEKRERDLQVMKRTRSQRNIPINAGIKTLDFDKAKVHADNIIEYSKKVTLQYLKNHEHECIQYSYDNLSDLMKNLPDEKYYTLIRNRKQYPFLCGVDLKKIHQARERHRKIPASLWPKFNNFMKSFYEFTEVLQSNHKIIKKLNEHFELISVDDSASDDVKMIRALSAVFDAYDDFNCIQEGEALKHFFNKQFSKQLKYLKQQNINEMIDDDDAVLSSRRKIQHASVHRFHMLYQRIVFLLKHTKSSVINTEDEHQRPFIVTILNDIQDLAALHLNDHEKMQRLEEYLFEAYHKVLYYRGTDKSNLCKALKQIIKSPDLLNLPFHYGVKLPHYIKELPEFPTNAPVDWRPLDALRSYKLRDFMRVTRNVMYHAQVISAHHFTFSLLDHYGVSFIHEPIDKQAVMYRAMVRTMLLSPHAKDQYYANRLNAHITPCDVANDRTSSHTLFYATSLLTRLMWLKPSQREQQLHHDFVRNITRFLHNYQNEDVDKKIFLKLLRTYLNKAHKIDQKHDWLTFFCGHGELYSLLKNYIEKDLKLVISADRQQGIQKAL